MDRKVYWRTVFASYGWVACPLAFGRHEELVWDAPVAVAAATALTAPTNSLSLGVPHPHHGVMRATVVVTPSSSLTSLSGVAHELAKDAFATSAGLPLIYVGYEPFTDRVGGVECTVLGVIVFQTLTGCQCAPLATVVYKDTHLPYFEDEKNWVMTGWDLSGYVRDIHKPFGWGCALVGSLEAERPRTCESVTGSNVL